MLLFINSFFIILFVFHLCVELFVYVFIYAGLHATSLMPGGIATPLQRHMDQAVLQAMMKNTAAIKFVKSTEQVARFEI